MANEFYNQEFETEFLNFKNKFKSDSPIQSLSFSSFKVPVFKERLSGHQKWVSCGQDNLFPNLLVDKLNKCSIHSSIVTNKVIQIVGEGMKVEDSNDHDQRSQLEAFLKKININDILRRVAHDYELFGYFFLGITWSNDRTKIANIYHVDAGSVRVSPIDKETRQVETMWFSDDWTRQKQKMFTPEEIPVFDPSRRIDANCLLMVRRYSSLARYYALPSYIAAITAISLDAAVGNYMLSTVENSFNPSLLINFNNGIPKDEMQRSMFSSLDGLYKGQNNAGRAIVSFNESKETATTIEPIETSNMSEIYSRISEYTTSNIVQGHRLPNPVLAGIAIPGQLGLTNEMAQSSELFFNQVIAPVQSLLEETIQGLMEINGFTLKVFIQDSQPISFTYEDATLVQICTVNELRRRINLPPLSDIDKANLVVNIKQEASKDGSTKDPKAVKPKAITEEQKIEQGMADETKANPVITGLSGRQNQAMMRIIKQYGQGKLTRQQASILLGAGYGLSDEQVETFLGEEGDDKEDIIDSIEKLKNYVVGDTEPIAAAIQTQLPKYVDEGVTKKKKANITTPAKLNQD